MAAAAFTAAAPAKLNLYLHVTGRRGNGYHFLDSLVAFAAIHDRVTVRAADGLDLAVDGRFATALPAPSQNLVLTAARRLAARAGVAPLAAIRLEKNLPVAAGLGGGSADAAAALRALAALWQIRPAPEDLVALAAGLGADVPACLASRAAFVGGVGEAVEPAGDLPEGYLVLANPGVPVPTAEVFAARRGRFQAAARFALPDTAAALAALLATRRNGLEAPARRLAPSIGTVLESLGGLAGCLLARMSGSGATCFGLFADGDAAAAGATVLAAAHPDWWVRMAPFADASAADALPV